MNLDREPPDKLLKTLERAAEAAAGAALRCRELGLQSGRKEGLTYSNELVTNADLEAEAAAGKVLQEAFPGIQIVAEESTHLIPASRTYFTVDAIDGSLCFCGASRDWGALVGLVQDGAPRGGVLYMPEHALCITVDRRLGAALNGAPLPSNTIAERTVATPIGPWTNVQFRRALEVVAARGFQVLEVPSAISGGFALLRGQASVYLAPRDKVWDSVPAAAAILSLGGVVFGPDGTAPAWNKLVTPCIMGWNKEEVEAVCCLSQLWE